MFQLVRTDGHSDDPVDPATDPLVSNRCVSVAPTVAVFRPSVPLSREGASERANKRVPPHSHTSTVHNSLLFSGPAQDLDSSANSSIGFSLWYLLLLLFPNQIFFPRRTDLSWAFQLDVQLHSTSSGVFVVAPFLGCCCIALEEKMDSCNAYDAVLSLRLSRIVGWKSSFLFSWAHFHGGCVVLYAVLKFAL